MKCNGGYRKGTMRRSSHFLVVMSLGLFLGSVCEAVPAVDMNDALPLEEIGIRPLREFDRIPASDSNAVAKIELLFMQKKGEGIVSMLSTSIGIMPEYFMVQGKSLEERDAIRRNERQHEAFGSMGLAGVDTPNGRIGVSFNVVPRDYTGTGWGVLIAGESYRIRMQHPVFAETWLHVPHDIVPGKTYVARWLVEPSTSKDAESLPTGPARSRMPLILALVVGLLVIVAVLGLRRLHQVRIQENRDGRA